MKKFTPDYKNLEDAAYNRKPKRTPLYEHLVSADIMERLTGRKFCRYYSGDKPDYDAFFKEFDRFFPEYGYDTVTYEGCITEILPGGGALGGHKKGAIDGAKAFENYPFNQALYFYIDRFKPRFDALKRNMPDGMKAVGGVGNGVFEIAQDLTGYENLCVMSYDEPEVFTALFKKIGDLMEGIWKWFLSEYKDTFCVMRFGDDLGYKSNTLLPHEDVKKLVLPQYKRIVNLVHSYNKPFLLHSCGCIFDVMDDVIATGINSKHSNEDQIAEFKVWVERYGSRIGNFGGVDTDHLVRMDDDKLKALVTGVYKLAQDKKGGIAIGSGNSIPDYVNEKKYALMINTVRTLRGDF